MGGNVRAPLPAKMGAPKRKTKPQHRRGFPGENAPEAARVLDFFLCIAKNPCTAIRPCAKIRVMTPAAAHCLNCHAALAPAQRFCSECGQATATRRLTVHDIGHALVHVFTHADHSVFSLVRDLATRPGKVAREYVEGKRKKYFNPFTFAVVVVGVASLVLAATRFVDFNRGVPTNPVTSFLQNHINLVILMQLPLLAMFGKLMFRRDKLFFAEHLVLAAYTSGFRSIFFTLGVIPLWLLFDWHYPTTVGVYVALWLTYFGIACAQFYQGNRWWLWLRGVMVGVLTQVLISGLIFAAIWTWFRLFPPVS
jgi:uncharacterized OB-fold protein